MQSIPTVGLEDEHEHAEDLLDEAIEESFPASDSPSHSAGRGRTSTSPERLVSGGDDSPR